MEVSGFYDLSHVISVRFLIEFMKNINMSLIIMHGLRKTNYKNIHHILWIWIRRSNCVM